MVDPHENFSFYLYRIKDFFQKALVHPWPCRIVRIALASLFVYGGVIKLLAPKAFAATLSAYDLAPEAALPLLAVGLPLVETIAGLALLLDRSWGLHLITGLLALFVFVLGYAILGNLDVDCGCFGAEELDKRAGLRDAFFRDTVLIGVVAPYLYLSRRIRQFSGGRKEK